MPWLSPLQIQIQIPIVGSFFALQGKKRTNKDKAQTIRHIILENRTAESMMQAHESYIRPGILWYACRE
jgi:hypothetical protein